MQSYQAKDARGLSPAARPVAEPQRWASSMDEEETKPSGSWGHGLGPLVTARGASITHLGQISSVTASLDTLEPEQGSLFFQLHSSGLAPWGRMRRIAGVLAASGHNLRKPRRDHSADGLDRWPHDAPTQALADCATAKKARPLWAGHGNIAAASSTITRAFSVLAGRSAGSKRPAWARTMRHREVPRRHLGSSLLPWLREDRTHPCASCFLSGLGHSKAQMHPITGLRYQSRHCSTVRGLWKSGEAVGAEAPTPRAACTPPTPCAKDAPVSPLVMLNIGDCFGTARGHPSLGCAVTQHRAIFSYHGRCRHPSSVGPSPRERGLPSCSEAHESGRHVLFSRVWFWRRGRWRFFSLRRANLLDAFPNRGWASQSCFDAFPTG